VLQAHDTALYGPWLLQRTVAGHVQFRRGVSLDWLELRAGELRCGGHGAGLRA